MPDPVVTPGQAVRAAREALGWTVYRLAQESGVAQQSIHLVERGERSMTIETAQALAAALGQSMAMFDAPVR